MKAGRASHHAMPRLRPAFTVSSGLSAPYAPAVLLCVLGYSSILPTPVPPTQPTRSKSSSFYLINLLLLVYSRFYYHFIPTVTTLIQAAIRSSLVH